MDNTMPQRPVEQYSNQANEPRPNLSLPEVSMPASPEVISNPKPENVPSVLSVSAVEKPQPEQQPQPQGMTGSDTYHTDGVTARSLSEKDWDDEAIAIIDNYREDPSQEDKKHHGLSREYLRSNLGLDVD